MRLRIAAPTAAVALAALTLVAGCNKGASNANGTNTNTTINTTMANSSPANTGGSTTTTASPTATTTTTNTSASTPTEAFRAYYEAVKRNDGATVRGLFSRATMQMLEDDAKRQNKSVDEVFNEGLKSASAEVPATMPEVRNEKIDGDRATLEINDTKKGKWETLKFVREGGSWKIAFAEDAGGDDDGGEDNN